MMLVFATPLTLGERYQKLLFTVWCFAFVYDITFTTLSWTFNPMEIANVYEEQSWIFRLAVAGSCFYILKWIWFAKFKSLRQLMTINKERSDVRSLIKAGHLKDATETILIKRGNLEDAVSLAYVK